MSNSNNDDRPRDDEELRDDDRPRDDEESRDDEENDTSFNILKQMRIKQEQYWAAFEMKQAISTYSQVFEKIYIGGIKAAESEATYRNTDFNSVISAKKATLPSNAPMTHISYLIKDDSSVDIRETMWKVAGIIERQMSFPGNILVHCRVGASRSVAFVAAWMIRYMGKTAEEALTIIKKGRKVADTQFYSQLLMFEEVCRQREADLQRHMNYLPIKYGFLKE